MPTTTPLLLLLALASPQQPADAAAAVRATNELGLGLYRARQGASRQEPVVRAVLDHGGARDARRRRVGALGEFGPRAKVALPRLIELLDGQGDPNDWDTRQLVAAIRAVRGGR